MASKSKMRLGRGLGAILDEVEEAYANDLRSGREEVVDIEVERIAPNPYQPRKHFNEESLGELSESIKRHGLLQPIIVVKNEEEGGYILLAGERRLRASKRAGMDTIRAIVAKELSPQSLREMALIENIQREDLNPVELAVAFKELLDVHQITHEELSKTVHKSRAYITNTIRLLNLSEYTKDKLVSSEISYGHAKVLVGLDAAQERKIVDSIVGQNLSVRDAEALARNAKNGTATDDTPTEKKSKTAKTLEMERLMTLLTAEGIKLASKGNKLTIAFADQTSVDNLITKLAD